MSFVTWFNGLGWRAALSLACLAGILVMWLICLIEKQVALAKKRRRLHRLDRLNPAGFFRSMASPYYRVRK